MSAGNPAARPLRWPGLVAMALTAGLLGVTGYWRMFSHFPWYDDEGYILQSVRSYLEQGHLYGKVYSQYGPGFYVLMDGWQRLTGVVIDHAAARWFTLALWWGTAAVMGVVTGRVTRSRALAWFGWVATFLFLHQFSEEAFHPGAVVCFLLAVTLCVVLELLGRNRAGWAAAAAGAGAALLGLQKVNVGVLFAAGCGLWWLFTAGRQRLGARAAWAGGVGGGLFAAALMHGLLTAAWVQVFLALVVAGLAGLAASVRARGPAGLRAAGAFGAGALVVGGLVVAAVLARGTSARELWAGVIAGPLRHAGAYSFAVDWRPGALLLAGVSLLALGVHRWLVGRDRPEAADRLLVGLRLAQLAGLLGVVALLEQFRVIGGLFTYSLPWLWIWVMPLRGGARAEADDRARGLVACVLLMQMLHAYPVGGIQVCWGSFLLFALGAMAVPETVAWLGRRAGPGWRGGTVLVGLMLVVAGGKAGATAWAYGRNYGARPELGLPGTAGMRLGERETAIHQILVTNSVAHGDMLFSLPGRLSYNLWSELPPPTAKNTTLWHVLLAEADQQAIVAALERARRPVVVVDHAVLAGLQRGGTPPDGPLYRYIMREFRPAFSLQGQGLWVKQGRAIAAIGTYRRTAAGGHAVCLLGSGDAVEAIELSDPDAPGGPRVVLDASNTRASWQRLLPDGAPQAAAREVGWPLAVEGLVRLTLESAAWPAGGKPLLSLRFQDGRRVVAALAADQ